MHLALLLIAHAGQPAEARLLAPEMLGVIADDSFTVTWRDTDVSIPTGTATVNLYYVADRPPTFFPGEIPPTLTGTAIAEGIFEKDPTNAEVWDTSSVPSGHYWIWSRVDEPPEPNPSPVYISFSPAPLTIRHGGDPIGPVVRITRPNTEIAFADESYEIRYEAFDPGGGATVQLEAGTRTDGTGFMLLAGDLPATSTGAFVWDTSAVAEADWTIRATITSSTGRFTAYAPYFLLVTRLGPPPDAGEMRDAGAPPADAGPPERDAGETTRPPPEAGCGCSAADRSGPVSLLFFFGILLLRWTRTAAARSRSTSRTCCAITRRARSWSSTPVAARRSSTSCSPPRTTSASP